MLLPMAALAAVCVLIGLFPAALLPALAGAASHWSGLDAALLAGPAAAAGASAARVTVIAAALVAFVLAAAWLRARRLRPTDPQPEAETWGCGFARPTPRMQYTGSSFAEMLVLRFGWAFSPRARVEPPKGIFPRHASFASHVPDTVLDRGIAPATSWIQRVAAQARSRFPGSVQSQALLLVAGVIALLAWLAVGGTP
jgi:hydrogenase-4 component B